MTVPKWHFGVAMDAHPLKVFRETRDPPLSQAQLAELLGVDRVSVTRWEAGSRKPGPEHLPKIRDVTGITARQLRPDLVEMLDGEAAP